MVRKYIIVFTFIVISSQYGFSQDILATKELKKGIYQNFNEFRLNSPSIPLDESLIEIKAEEKVLIETYTGFIVYETKEITIQTYRFKDKQTQKRINTKKFWGYCDGSNVYINSYTHIPAQYFVQLLIIGRYCYFIQPGDKVDASGQISHIGSYNLTSEYIININTGKIFKLDRQLLKEILQRDPELLEELKNDKESKNTLISRRRLLMDYIDSYNKKHMDEIKIPK